MGRSSQRRRRPAASLPRAPPPFRPSHVVEARLLQDVYDPTVARGGALTELGAYSEQLLEVYSEQLDKHPLATKAMTTLVGWFLSDLLAQVRRGRNLPVDWKRLAALSLFGFVYRGPSDHYWYNWLDKKVPGTDTVSVFSKVAIDQLLWCPIFMSVFFVYFGLVINGDGLAAIGSKITNGILLACRGTWKVWPLVHLINFKLVCNKWRIPYINAVEVAFNMFISVKFPSVKVT